MRRDIKDSSILIISHQERILAIADEIIVIKEGRVLEHGVGSEVLPKLMGTDSAVPECKMGMAAKEGEEDDTV